MYISETNIELLRTYVRDVIRSDVSFVPTARPKFT
jgi:hypothetical protein